MILAILLLYIDSQLLFSRHMLYGTTRLTRGFLYTKNEPVGDGFIISFNCGTGCCTFPWLLPYPRLPCFHKQSGYM